MTPPLARVVAAAALFVAPSAGAQTVQDLQRQIDELKAQIKLLTEARATQAGMPAPSAVATADVATAQPVATPAPQLASATPPPAKTAWYNRLQFRGYTQLRYNAVLDGDLTAPAGQSRLRSVHDSSINEKGGFALRRVRVTMQGDLTDRLSLYLQHDFGTAVAGQSNDERRDNFGQLRDAYVDWFLDADHTTRLRFGQSKVPYGWENPQSSSSRLALDRSDAINSGVPNERDLGVVAYYTPPHVQAIWDRLAHDGQKLFGNYGAFGVGLYNGQGTNRPESNDNLMKVAMATWPFALDSLGSMFDGQVLEIGASALINRFRPEVRTGGVTDHDFADERVGVHAILYPQPFGIQTEWNWGHGPEYDTDLQAIRTKRLNGGYIQAMYDLRSAGIGPLMPYTRWQYYRGGWKAATNAPRLETDELELGVEWQFVKDLELTLAYARMKRREADERRTGRAEGDLIRTQLQWSY